MVERGPHLAGEIVADMSLNRLAAILQAGNLPANVRESSHYVGGRYIRINRDTDFSFEEIAQGEFLARADADDGQQLFRTATCISQVLTEHGIRHRFEIYDGNSTLVEYVHYLWPHN